MRTFLIFILAAFTAFGSVPTPTYTEFYIQTTGDNLNSGSTADNAATFSAASGYFTNNTTATTCTFFKSGLNPVAGGVTNGAWASVYTNGQIATAWIATVTAADDTADTVTMSLTAKAGNLPSTDETGVMSIKVGGAWKGPGGHTGDTGYAATNTFPFALVANTITNSSGIPRINIKGGTTYSITNGLIVANAGPIRFQGYTTTPGDGGKATIDGGTVYPGYALLTCTGNYEEWADVIFANNGVVGSTDGIAGGGNDCVFVRCVIHDISKNGILPSGSGWSAWECEAYACGKGNGSGVVAFNGLQCYRCIAHDNTGSSIAGFYISTGGILVNCIADSNGRQGAVAGPSASGTATIINCDFYNNTYAGISLSGGNVNIENCNFANNGSGITNTAALSGRVGRIANCGFGTGTAANTYGTITNLFGPLIRGCFEYSANALPWTDAPNGDFRINLTAAKATGAGGFTETAGSYAGTVGYPDIGAAQNASTNAAAAGGAYTFAQ